MGRQARLGFSKTQDHTLFQTGRSDIQFVRRDYKNPYRCQQQSAIRDIASRFIVNQFAYGISSQQENN